MAQPARRASRPPEAPPVDPAAVARAYRVHRARRRARLERDAGRREVEQQRGPVGPQPGALHAQPVLLLDATREHGPAVAHTLAGQHRLPRDRPAEQRADVVPQRPRGAVLRLAQQVQQAEPLEQPARPPLGPPGRDAAERAHAGRRARGLRVDEPPGETVPGAPRPQPAGRQPAADEVAQRLEILRDRLPLRGERRALAHLVERALRAGAEPWTAA
jgi:hypothetical protein